MATEPLTFLHLEASTGWGGQEIRTLKEATNFRNEGHHLFFAVQIGAELGRRAEEAGFSVVFLDFRRRKILSTIPLLLSLIEKKGVDIVVTHSSKDSWIGGFAAKLAGCPVVRTRHLSTPIKRGLNSYLLYNYLADKVVTTCESVAVSIRKQASLTKERCSSVPTGIEPELIEKGLLNGSFSKPSSFVVGTACVLRSWKGIQTMIEALSLIPDENISLLILGEGPMRPHLEKQAKELHLLNRVYFSGHLENPFPAINQMDLFLLLSTAHEGVSQATLQAGYLGKPLITTPTGGLPEIAIQEKTGYVVPLNDPFAVATAIMQLKTNHHLRNNYSQGIRKLILDRFLWKHTQNKLMEIYSTLAAK